MKRRTAMPGRYGKQKSQKKGGKCCIGAELHMDMPLVFRYSAERNNGNLQCCYDKHRGAQAAGMLAGKEGKQQSC